jgi:toxin ParE1/3/4
LRTPEAADDLAPIVRYIAGDNSAAALHWLDEIEALFHLMTTQPRMGERVRLPSSREIRRHTFGRYVIYYHPLPDGVEIYRVLHGAREHERLI